MRATLPTISYRNQNLNTDVEIPDSCPSCGRLIVFNVPYAVYSTLNDRLEAVIHCNFRECLSYTFCYFKNSHNVWILSHTEPPVMTQENLPDFAREISESFVSIFGEAEDAESRGLSQIAGPGYRKAFEFLIKDYAKSTADPNNFDDIEKQAASSVVNNYISDTRVQAVAKRALWIGNDETHYLRKWETKDISDLKLLVKLTLEWIDIERQSAAYIDEMPDSTSAKQTNST